MTILYFLTRGPVQVTIDSGKSTSTSSQLVTTSSTASASSSAASGATTIYGYFVALAADFPNGLPTEEMSAGTVSFGQDYIVKVVMKENVAAADPLQEALDTLLAVKQSTYGEQEYRNLLANSTLTAVITDKETNGTTSKQIDLQGEVVASSTSDYTYIKQQLERTVEVYTFNYSLLLNGSSLAYRCLGDPSCV